MQQQLPVLLSLPQPVLKLWKEKESEITVVRLFLLSGPQSDLYMGAVCDHTSFDNKKPTFQMGIGGADL